MTPTEICEKVNAGDLSPLLAYVRLKELEKELENAINQIKD